MKDVKHYLNEEKRRVDRYLNKVLPRETGNLKEFSSSLRYAVFSGGKRIRPVFLLHIYGLCGGKGDKALPAAAAVELIHTFSLIQDDLPSMDNDDLRRGKPTLHRAYPEYTALLASDYLLILAFELLAGNYPAEVLFEVTRAIGLEGLTAGQFLDLKYKIKSPDRKTLEEIRQKKTAALFRLVFKLASMIAGEERSRVDLLAEYGLKFGLAFQIRDDLHDAERLEPVKRMKEKVGILAGEMEGMERRLRISSPVLPYFRAFLQRA